MSNKSSPEIGTGSWCLIFICCHVWHSITSGSCWPSNGQQNSWWIPESNPIGPSGILSMKLARSRLLLCTLILKGRRGTPPKEDRHKRHCCLAIKLCWFNEVFCTVHRTLYSPLSGKHDDTLSWPYDPLYPCLMGYASFAESNISKLRWICMGNWSKTLENVHVHVWLPEGKQNIMVFQSNWLKWINQMCSYAIKWRTKSNTIV